MKVLYVDLMYDYGVKERGLNYIGQDGFKKNIQRLGYDLDTFYYDQYLNSTDQLQTDIIKKAKDFDPDLIFFMLFSNQFSQETLDYLKARYQTISWFGDDTWRFDSYTKFFATHFTWCITTDKFSIYKYKEIGQKNVILSQWAAIDSHKIVERKKDYLYDVSFVGGISPYRKWFVETLQKAGLQISVFGNGWKRGKVTNDEMNEIFVNSKINLNISNSESFDLRYLLHIPFRFRDNSSNSIKEKLKPVAAKVREWRKIITKTKGSKSYGQIKARNFEIPYFSGFQLTNYFPGIEDYFDIGREIACYSDVDEAELLIRYYLDHEADREEIKNKSHSIAVNKHGYLNRLEPILNQVFSNQK